MKLSVTFFLCFLVVAVVGRMKGESRQHVDVAEGSVDQEGLEQGIEMDGNEERELMHWTRRKKGKKGKRGKKGRKGKKGKKKKKTRFGGSKGTGTSG